MIYEVNLYYDKINAREKPRVGFGSQTDQWRVFQTEQEAKDFIIRRARINLENVEAEFRSAKRHLAKVVKRFGTPCKHGIEDPSECGLCDDELVAAGRGAAQSWRGTHDHEQRETCRAQCEAQ